MDRNFESQEPLNKNEIAQEPLVGALEAPDSLGGIRSLGERTVSSIFNQFENSRLARKLAIGGVALTALFAGGNVAASSHSAEAESASSQPEARASGKRLSTYSDEAGSLFRRLERTTIQRSRLGIAREGWVRRDKNKYGEFFTTLATKKNKETGENERYQRFTVRYPMKSLYRVGAMLRTGVDRRVEFNFSDEIWYRKSKVEGYGLASKQDSKPWQKGGGEAETTRTASAYFRKQKR